MPDHCPACGGEIVRLEGEAVHRCVNPYCPSRGLEGLRHFVSRGALDIDGVGEKLIARFWELGLVRRAPDLYALTAEQLAELDGFQQRSAENVIASIAAVARAPVRPGAVRTRHPARGRGHRRGDRAALPLAGRPARRRGRTRSRRSRASGPIVAESVAAWLAFPRQRRGARRSRRRRALARADGRRAAARRGTAGGAHVRDHRHARRRSRATRPRRASSSAAARSPTRSRSARATSSPARARARSSRRPRASACPSSTTRPSSSCSRTARPRKTS